jgi:hypothetical protein
MRPANLCPPACRIDFNDLRALLPSACLLPNALRWPFGVLPLDSDGCRSFGPCGARFIANPFRGPGSIRIGPRTTLGRQAEENPAAAGLRVLSRRSAPALHRRLRPRAILGRLPCAPGHRYLRSPRHPDQGAVRWGGQDVDELGRRRAGLRPRPAGLRLQQPSVQGRQDGQGSGGHDRWICGG